MLEGGTALQFYGAVVQHLTSVVLAVNSSHVRYTNGEGYVIAWGEGGSSDNSAGGADPIIPPPELEEDPPPAAGVEDADPGLNLDGQYVFVRQETGEEAGRVWKLFVQDQGAPMAGSECVEVDMEDSGQNSSSSSSSSSSVSELEAIGLHRKQFLEGWYGNVGLNNRKDVM